MYGLVISSSLRNIAFFIHAILLVGTPTGQAPRGFGEKEDS